MPQILEKLNIRRKEAICVELYTIFNMCCLFVSILTISCLKIFSGLYVTMRCKICTWYNPVNPLGTL